ncbi:hypothetical protein JTB14_030676 [Gonioctena quinquepunctata]|nr:hypothetical protein JTB14_030676 [Gonioctena quinquepunctata]
MYSVDTGFIKADSANLPELDIFMVMDYFNENKDFISVEMRGIKLQRSGRQSYGDNAIGYVQLKQQGALCELKAKITPEHKIKSRNYSVSCSINTKEKVVVNLLLRLRPNNRKIMFKLNLEKGKKKKLLCHIRILKLQKRLQ